MSIYTRLTVAGSARRSDVVVSSAEPLGAALPRLLDLLGETGGTVSRPLTLVAPDGEQLDIARSPQQLDLADGTLLRLVRLDAAPPPPVVIDVTDAAADAHDARPDRWDARARAIAGGTAIALAFAAAGSLAPIGGPVIARGRAARGDRRAARCRDRARARGSRAHLGVPQRRRGRPGRSARRRDGHAARRSAETGHCSWPQGS